MLKVARKQRRAIGGMSLRAAPWLGWSLCVLCLALAVASPILALLNGRTLGEIFLALDGPSIAGLAIETVSFSIVGALVASHRSENPIGWIFLAVGFFYGLLNAGEEYAIYTLLTNPSSLLPLGAEFSWLAKWIWAPGLGLILVFLPLLFPDGRPPSRRWRLVGWLGGLSIGLICILIPIVLWPERGPALVRPGGYEEEVEAWRSAVLGWLWSLVVPMMFVAGLGAVISLLVRYRRAGGDERQQIKWFASAAALSLVWIFVFGQSSFGGLPGAIVALTSLLVIPSVPIATGIAILRYRLYDIDLLINRTLVYGALSVSVVGLYILVVASLGALLQVQGSLFVSLLATGLIAVLFAPLRDRAAKGSQPPDVRTQRRSIQGSLRPRRALGDYTRPQRRAAHNSRECSPGPEAALRRYYPQAQRRGGVR